MSDKDKSKEHDVKQEIQYLTDIRQSLLGQVAAIERWKRELAKRIENEQKPQ